LTYTSRKIQQRVIRITHATNYRARDERSCSEINRNSFGFSKYFARRRYFLPNPYSDIEDTHFVQFRSLIILVYSNFRIGAEPGVLQRPALHEFADIIKRTMFIRVIHNIVEQTLKNVKTPLSIGTVLIKISKINAYGNQK